MGWKSRTAGIIGHDLKQIFDFIRCSEDKERLRMLIQNDPAFQEMDETAYDIMTLFKNMHHTEKIEI